MVHCYLLHSIVEVLLCFVHAIFRFWFYKNAKILRNLCLHFAKLDGKTEKKWKKNHATVVTKISQTKRPKYGMNTTFLSFWSQSCPNPIEKAFETTLALLGTR